MILLAQNNVRSAVRSAIHDAKRNAWTPPEWGTRNCVIAYTQAWRKTMRRLKAQERQA